MSDVQNRLGARVKEWRRRRGWSQEALGERSGLSDKFIGEIERGIGNPTVESLDRLARAFGIDPSDLLQKEASEPTYATLASGDYAILREARQSIASIDNLIKRLGAGKTSRRRAAGRRR